MAEQPVPDGGLPPWWREMTDITCANCSNDDDMKGRYFDNTVRIKKLSGLDVRNTKGHDVYWKVIVFVCRDCGFELNYVDDEHRNCIERASWSLQ